MNKQTLEYIEDLKEFDDFRMVQVFQEGCDSDMSIVSYMIGDDPWITLIEEYTDTKTHRVNLSGKGITELLDVLTKCLKHQSK